LGVAILSPNDIQGKDSAALCSDRETLLLADMIGERCQSSAKGEA
jgi:hypothetical protein